MMVYVSSVYPISFCTLINLEKNTAYRKRNSHTDGVRSVMNDNISKVFLDFSDSLRHFVVL